MYFVPHFGHAKVYETSIWTPCFQISAKTLYSGLIHQLQLASNDIATLWQKKWRKSKFQIPNSKIVCGFGRFGHERVKEPKSWEVSLNSSKHTFLSEWIPSCAAHTRNLPSDEDINQLDVRENNVFQNNNIMKREWFLRGRCVINPSIIWLHWAVITKCSLTPHNTFQEVIDVTTLEKCGSCRLSRLCREH